MNTNYSYPLLCVRCLYYYAVAALSYFYKICEKLRIVDFNVLETELDIRMFN